jgi:hypothetical protein
MLKLELQEDDLNQKTFMFNEDVVSERFFSDFHSYFQPKTSLSPLTSPSHGSSPESSPEPNFIPISPPEFIPPSIIASIPPQNNKKRRLETPPKDVKQDPRTPISTSNGIPKGTTTTPSKRGKGGKTPKWADPTTTPNPSSSPNEDEDMKEGAGVFENLTGAGPAELQTGEGRVWLPRETLLKMTSAQFDNFARRLSANASPPLSDQELLDLKSQRRMIKNRQYAHDSRQKKKTRADQMQATIADLTHQNNLLRAENAQLKTQLQIYRSTSQQNAQQFTSPPPPSFSPSSLLTSTSTSPQPDFIDSPFSNDMLPPPSPLSSPFIFTIIIINININITST